jgi:hypothetical protein
MQHCKVVSHGNHSANCTKHSLHFPSRKPLLGDTTPLTYSMNLNKLHEMNK